MLAALNVIKGYEDGSYRPDEIVTRAEMAKMIYVIRNGGSDVVTQYEDYTTPFTDVENVNHWAKGYIAYCYANGIIAGTSATTFKPDAPVSGQEAAKMALVLIGYDAERAGLEGASWAVNTTNLATQKDLFDNYTVSITAGAPRQYAAQLLYNTLWAGTVRWSNDSDSYEDVVDYNQDTNGVVVGLAYVTVAKRYMDLEDVNGTYNGDSNVNHGLSNGQSKVGGATITFVPENGNEWLGESVKVLYKNSKDGNTKGLDKYDTIYGMTLSGETSTVKAVKGDIGDPDNGKIKVNDVKYDLAGSVKIYQNQNDTAYTTVANATDFNTELKKDSADEIKLVLNDNSKVEAVYVNHVDFYQVTGLTSTKVSLAGLGTLDIDDSLSLDENVAVGDIVGLTTLYATTYNDDDAYNIIKKADVAEDVTVSNRKSATEVMINDNYSKYASINDKVSASDNNYKTTADLNATYDFVMYGDYWVAAKKVSASAKDIALVTKTDSGISEQVKVLKGDGTETVYVYDDDDNKGAAFTYLKDQAGDDTSKADRLYSFSLISDNKIQLKNGTKTTSDQNGGEAVTGLTFKAATAIGDSSSPKKLYNEDNKTVYVDGSSYVADEDAVVFVYTGGKNYVYNINDLKTIYAATTTNGAYATSTDVEYVYNDDKEIVAMYVETDKKPGATASNTQYGYVVDDVQESSVDGTEYREVSIWNGTETVTVKVETSSALSVVKGSFVKFTVGANGLTDTSDLVMLSDGNVGAVSSYDAGRKLLTVYTDMTTNKVDGGTNTYKVADDVVIIGVNTKDKKLVEGLNSVTKAFVDTKNTAETTDDTFKTNIVYVLNSDKEVVAIFVDTNNELTSNTGALDSSTTAVTAD